MKTRILSLLIIIGIGFFTSCDKNDDNASQFDNLNGTWNLKKIHGGFAGISTYDIGDITWTFNVLNNTVSIENNIMTSIELDSGTYDYRIEQKEDQPTLYINNIEKGAIVMLSSTRLKIDFYSDADGFFTELEK